MTAAGMRTATVDEVLDDLERILGAIRLGDSRDGDRTGFQLVDRVGGGPGAAGSNRAHLGVSVEIPTTRNTDRLRDRDVVWVEDTATVTLWVHLAPHGQKASRREALQHELRIREVLERARQWETSYRGSARRVVEGYLEIVQTFRCRRLEARGAQGGV